MDQLHRWEVTWIARPEEPRRLSFEKDWANLERQSMPMPGRRGKAWVEYYHFGQGIDGFKSRLFFDPEEEPRMLRVGELKGSLSEPMLWLTYLAEGRGALVDRIAGTEFPLGRSGACIRHLDHFDELTKYDTREPLYQVDLTIRDSALTALLGEGERDKLLSALDLGAVPSAVLRPLPVPIAELMRTLLPDNLSGRVRLLYSQGKALEILSALMSHFRGSGSSPQPATDDKILPRLHDELLQCEGRVFLLSELAEKYGLPARQLNEEFKRSYGSTIYVFMINRRLDLAYEAVRGGDQPLKLIAAELGYSNVNNFLVAFKRRHGISPGRLRKGHRPEGPVVSDAMHRGGQ